MTAPELVADVHATVGEGPSWDDVRCRLLWVDILGGCVHIFDPPTGRDAMIPLNRPVSAAIPASDGRILVCMQGEIALLNSETHEIEQVAAIEPDLRTNRTNDAKCDTMGRLWVGTMDCDVRVGAGALYRLDPTGPTAIVSATTCSNGIGWSPDSSTMYYIDSLAGGVDAFDFDVGAGEISNRHRIIDFPTSGGLPDGLCIDAHGGIWFAVWGAGCIRRHLPDGRLDSVLELPVRFVTSCCFGGVDLDDLYITTASSEPDAEAFAGGLFRARPGVRGLPTNVFETARSPH
jgi:sugar lactone lactonase YvrE